MKKIEKKRQAIRLKNYDYSETGGYFVTICTKNRELFFENVRIKDIVSNIWQSLPSHHKVVALDEFVIMPNHVHGILIIEEDCRDIACNVPLADTGEKPAQGHSALCPYINKFGRLQAGSLSAIIRSFKSENSKILHQNGFSNFSWQDRFYEHIIRNEKSLNNIRQYIMENPLRWNLDAENPDNWKHRGKIDIAEYYKDIITKTNNET